MNFFLPSATTEEQAERMYAKIASRLKKIGYDFTAHRIARVAYKRDGGIVRDSVCSPTENGEIVIAIFKNDIGYFICTYSQGAVWGHPITVRYSVVDSAQDFDRSDFNETSPDR